MKIVSLFAPYLRRLEVLNRSPGTIRSHRFHLKRFGAFLTERRIGEVEEIGKDALLGYQEEIAWAMTAKGERLNVTTQTRMLIVVRGFMKWLYLEDYVALDLCGVIQLPKIPDPLPKEVIEREDLRKLVRVIDLTSPFGYRDRTMVEVLYSTGLRVGELAHLGVQDVDCDDGFVYVHRGKGGRDRVVPMGKIACEFVRGYLAEARPRLLKKESTDALFLNLYGARLSRRSVEFLIEGHVRRAGIRKRITPHCFRVACTTGMLRNGAHLKHLQEMLGHRSATSLGPYLRLTINELKQTHARFHPRERPEP
jgi:integrase/recombinase XerD